ncbi:MAG: hypothetical protein VYA51_12895 [Planctomycetota bacterium]|nr:hypothetical protein [Planctomycetota bacterium]
MDDLNSLFGAPAAQPPAAQPAPAAQPPAAQQPVAQQPVAQQPVAQQPAAQQPVAQQPVAQPPVVADWMYAIADAPDINRGADYMRAGHVVGAITVIKDINKESGGKGFAIEFEVVETASAHMPIGSVWSIYRDVPGKNRLGASDVKAWLMAILNGIAASTGQTAPKFSGELVAACLGERLKGQRIQVRGTDKVMNNGGTFTRFNVEYVPANTIVGLTVAA